MNFRETETISGCSEKISGCVCAGAECRNQKRIGGLQERIGKEQKIKQLVDEGYALEQKIKTIRERLTGIVRQMLSNSTRRFEDRIKGLEKQRAGQAELEKKGHRFSNS